MYLINKEKNRIEKLKKRTFSELNFTERHHLQEWIANNPSCLGEDLLIIQKEFSGFDETKERLDLLALDKAGNIVVIENKLDDSGKDVTWQIIKYASYCSSLTKQEIIKIYQDFLGASGDAKIKLSEFYDNKDIDEIILNQGLNSQRLILVAANFRKEVTSTVLWLLNYKIRIQCFKVTPYSFNEELFLTIEQILPTRDTEDFTISIASKAQEEIEVQETLKNRHLVRVRFWEYFLNRSNQENNLFANISPAKDNWLGIGIGMSGVGVNLVISKNYCRSELYINRGNKEENKYIFDYLYKNRDIIEQEFGGKLLWERMDENVTSRIKSELEGVNYFEEDDWDKMTDFLIDSSVRMEKVFKNQVKKLNRLLKNK